MEYSEYISILLGVLNLFLLIVVLRLSTQVKKYRSSHDKQIKLLNAEISALCTGAAGTGAHLSRVEQKVKRILERQDQLDLRDPSDRALDQATRMARQGATVEELIAKCGLVRAEAELLALLHRAQVEHDDNSLRVVSG